MVVTFVLGSRLQVIFSLFPNLGSLRTSVMKIKVIDLEGKRIKKKCMLVSNYLDFSIFSIFTEQILLELGTRKVEVEREQPPLRFQCQGSP